MMLFLLKYTKKGYILTIKYHPNLTLSIKRDEAPNYKSQLTNKLQAPILKIIAFIVSVSFKFSLL